MRRIILPSAFRRALPAYGNEVIFNLQTTTLASTVTVIDLLGAARLLNNNYYLAAEGFLTAAVIYIAIVLIIMRIFRLLERRLFRHLPQCLLSKKERGNLRKLQADLWEAWHVTHPGNTKTGRTYRRS